MSGGRDFAQGILRDLDLLEAKCLSTQSALWSIRRRLQEHWGIKHGFQYDQQPQTQLQEFALRRQSHLETFNGGYKDAETLEAFHHGIETVFNSIDAEVRGEGRQA